MATGKVLFYLGQHNYIDYEFWWCSPSLLNSSVGKRQKEAIIKMTSVYEDIVDETPVPFPAHWRDFWPIPMFVH